MPLVNQLAHLEISGLLRRASNEAELEYLFRHALIQDAAYTSLLRVDRKVLHLAIGEALEQHYAQQLTELAPTLAYHFARAEATPRARHYLALAAHAALANYANAEAEGHYRAALDLGADEAERAQLLAGLGEALLYQSKFQEAGQVWREAIASCQTLGDQAGVARMYARAARTAGTAHGGDPRRALALCREGLAAMTGQPESSALAVLWHETGRACFFNGLLDEARAFCQQALTLAERLGDVEAQAETLTTFWGLLPADSAEAANAGLYRAAELAESIGRLDTAARIYHNLGFRLGIEQGEPRQGRAHFQHAVELFRRIGDEAGEFYTLDAAIVLPFLLGSFGEVEHSLGEMRKLLPSLGNLVVGQMSLRGWEAWLQRCRGEWENASQTFQPVRSSLREQQAFDTLANMDCTFADMYLELDDLPHAEEMLREALDLMERGFMEPVEPRSLLVALSVRQGQLAKARQVFAESRALAGPQPGAFDRLALALAEARLATAELHWSAAFAAFETACAQATQHSFRWHHAQILREWAEAHLARSEPGDVDHARVLLNQAQTLFAEMNAPKYAALVHKRFRSLDP